MTVKSYGDYDARNPWYQQYARVDPSLLEKVGKLERQKIADQLNERLLSRPGPIELIQDHILPVESPIQNAIDQGNVVYEQTVSPASSAADSPSVSELESGIHTLNCTSPSPPPSDLYGEAFRNQLKTVSESSHVSPLLHESTYSSAKSQISISQKENERLVKSINKKTRQAKPKVKKLKFHECLPAPAPSNVENNAEEVVDERYKRLLEQQTLYLRLQVMQQNAVMNALQGNTESMEAVTEEIENIITKEQSKSDSQAIKSIDGKKLDDLRVIDLRAQLKQRGLLVSGSKAKLIERLTAFEEGKATAADFAYAGNNSMHESLPKAHSQADFTPVTTVMLMQQTPANSGQTYQVIQTVPQSPQNIMQYQMLPTQSTVTSQTIAPLHIDQVNTLPVVAVTQPNIMTIHETISEKQTVNSITSPSSQIQFHVTPPPQQPSPTIVLHPGLPLQRASLIRHERTKVHVQKLPVISQGECYMPDSTLSQSYPSPSMQYNNNYLINSHTNLNYQHSLSNSSLNSLNSFNDPNSLLNDSNLNTSNTDLNDIGNQQFRGRASSEPHSHLKRTRSRPENSTKSVYSNHNSQLKMSGTSIQPSSPYYDQRQLSLDSKSSLKSENIDDIMDLIGELSTPSPTYGPPKSENPPPYNSCLYSKQQTDQMNKFLNVNQQQQQQKSFGSSVPENMNVISGSPSQTYLSSPYASLSGSMTNLPYQSSFNNLNHSSSTGSIPQQVQAGENLLMSTSPYRMSPGTPSNFMNCNSSISPLSPGAESMDLDKFPASTIQNNSLNWLDLNMEPTSPPSLQYEGAKSSSDTRMNNSTAGYTDYQQNVFNNPNAVYASQNRSENSIYGSSPKPQDGYVSLFDIEGGEY